jgi:putative membrane protein
MVACGTARSSGNARHQPSSHPRASNINNIAVHVALPGIASAAAVLSAGGVVLAFADLGPLSGHMARHIALMNVLAPLVAVLLLRNGESGIGRRVGPPWWLWPACALQLLLLWAWHAPPAQGWGMASATAHLAMHGSLFAAAVLFWTAVLNVSAIARWQSIVALLVTGKLVCLLGALLILAPRLLYSAAAGPHAHHMSHGVAGDLTLADQHFAGLLMIAACPLSYLVAGVVLAAQTMVELGRRDTLSRQPG